MPGLAKQKSAKEEGPTVEVPLEEIQKLISEAARNPDPEVVERLKEYERKFSEWMALLIDGHFNILLYGFGSKRTLLERFVEKEIKPNGYWHLVVKGFSSEATGEQMLRCLAKNLNIPVKGISDLEMAEEIIDNLDNRKEKHRTNVILIIHNIDGPSLRDKVTQAALSKLAENRNFRLIASVDHVNAGLLWDQSMLDRFRFLYMEAPTFDRYTEEIMEGNSKILGLKSTTTSRAHSLASLESLWASLTKNSQSVLVQLVRRYFSIKDIHPTVAFWDLYQLSRAEFLVNSEASLRHILTEFRDHSVVAQKKRGDGSEAYALLVSKRVIVTFLEEKGYADILPEDDDEEEKSRNQNTSDSDSD